MSSVTRTFQRTCRIRRQTPSVRSLNWGSVLHPIIKRAWGLIVIDSRYFRGNVTGSPVVNALIFPSAARSISAASAEILANFPIVSVSAYLSENSSSGMAEILAFPSIAVTTAKNTDLPLPPSPEQIKNVDSLVSGINK